MEHVMEVDRSLPNIGARTRSLPPVHKLMALQLNADYQPLGTWPLSLIPASDAITDFYKDRVTVVDTWKDAYGNDICFRSSSISIPAPKVVVLKEYVYIDSDSRPTRRNIYLRDRFICQYCGDKFPSTQLTFDHLIPRDKGGKTTWTNIVTACGPCNTRKANKMPDWGGKKGSALRPFKVPKQPSNNELLRLGLEFLPASIRESYGDWLYWNCPLDP